MPHQHEVALSVNVNKIATLRNARGGNNPNVCAIALLAIDAGCDGITVHPRPDERHIRRSDVGELKAILPPEIEFNIEGYPSDDFLALVEAARPAQCTLVPDGPDVLTSNAGWDLGDVAARAIVEAALARLSAASIRTSLFLDPDIAQVEAAAEVGCDRIELYTEDYARSFGAADHEAVLGRYVAAAARATALGLGVNAGHDLDLENLPTFARRVDGLLEVSIGHALIADAIVYGLAATVRAYKAALA